MQVGPTRPPCGLPTRTRYPPPISAMRWSPKPPRVLIITTSVGVGQDLPQKALGLRFVRVTPDCEVHVKDARECRGPLVSTVSHRAPQVVCFGSDGVWDAGVWLFAGCAPTRQFSRWILSRGGSPRLRQLIGRPRPNVIVSRWPITTEFLARMLRRGQIQLPVVASTTDVAALHCWAAPDLDLHLGSCPESEPKVRRIAAPNTRIAHVRGMTCPGFLAPRDRERSDPTHLMCPWAVGGDGRTRPTATITVMSTPGIYQERS